MKAYIFYNGDDVGLPDETEQSNWGGYLNPDSAKMFAVCAESWRRAGWEIERLKLGKHYPFWRGRLAKSAYPYNHLISFLAGNRQFDEGIMLVTTDVINYGFYEWSINKTRYADIPALHFTMSVGWFSSQFLYDAFMLLVKYDAGEFADVPEHTDENVLRHHGKVLSHSGLDSYCRLSKGLMHYSRSMLKRELNKYPTLLV